MTIQLKITAVAMHSGTVHQGTTTFADLQKADRSAYLTIEKEDGTILSLNMAAMEVMHVQANREKMDSAADEFRKQLEEIQAKQKAWKEAEAKAAEVKAEAEHHGQKELDLKHPPVVKKPKVNGKAKGTA